VDIVEVPLLSINASLRQAIAVMRQTQRSAVVALENGECWLFKAGWVVAGLAREDRILADLARKYPVHLAPDAEMAQEGIDLTNPRSTWSAAEQFLDRVGKFYALGLPTASPGSMARIITRHEGQAAEAGSGPADCYCTNPNQSDDPHAYDQPIPVDRKCTYDGSDIVCV
jgi:hypothetical protein